MCQQMKVNTHSSSSELIPLHIQKNVTPFFQVTCDFITNLPMSNGFDSLMAMVDHDSSKGVICISCNKIIDVLQTAQFYIDHVYRRFELPESFLSDRGPQFNSLVFREIAWILGFKTFKSTAYHPQTNGETECINQKLEIYLWIFCSNNPETWNKLVSIIEFCHNQHLHSTTKQTPLHLIIKYKPKDIPLRFKKTHVSTAEEQLQLLREAWNKASTAHELARQWVAE